MMEKMKFETKDLTRGNIAKIGQLFPEVLTETKDENGTLKKAIDFDKLRQILSDSAIDNRETYDFTWVGKKQAILEAATPIRKTLRPCKEESVNWDTTQNLYIEGDNLDVLKILQESYLGKVKMIYIDPPYNTGNDFIYKDDFAMSQEEYEESGERLDEEGNRLVKNTDANGRFHSDWCSMMYPRLKLARNLLTEAGIVLISIDDNEISNLQKLCDEVFGEKNRISTLVWNCSTAGGIRPKHTSKTHEYILVYSKNISLVPTLWAPLSEDAKKMYTEQDEKGIFRSKEFVFKNSSTNLNQKYAIKCPDDSLVKPKFGYIYRFIESTFNEAKTAGLVVFKRTDSSSTLIDETGAPAKWNIFIKKYLNEGLGCPATLLSKDLVSMYNKGTQDVQVLFDNHRVFNNAKPISLISYLSSIFCNNNDMIMDFFSGSATTAHAVMKLNAEDGGNRKFIMVQLPEECDKTSEAYKAGYKNICEIGKERIRRAAKQIKEEYPESNFDNGFRVFKLADSNMKDVYYNPAEYTQDLLDKMTSNIKEDRNDMDLLYGCMLEWGLPLSYPHTSEKVGSYTIHTVNNGDLMACFDENVTEDIIRHIAAKKPLRVVFRDAGFADSPAKINVGELFKLISPDTKVKVI